MFNHSAKQNVGFVLDHSNDTIKYYATRDIAAGEELCINYGPYLWFTSSEEPAATEEETSDEADDDPDANVNKWLYSK